MCGVNIMRLMKLSKIMIILHKSNYYYSTKIHDSHFFSGFSTKKTPDLKKLFPTIKHIGMKQIHSDIIWNIDKKEDMAHGDGIITQQKNVLIYVRTADCVPIIFADKKKGIIGVSHQGWRGTLNRLPQKMVQKFIQIGSKKEDIVASIGPAIGICCYKIYGDRKKQFEKEFTDIKEKYIETRDNESYLNLQKLNYLQLIETGINSENLDTCDMCTYSNAELFFSYQRNDMKSEQKNFIWQN